MRLIEVGDNVRKFVTLSFLWYAAVMLSTGEYSCKIITTEYRNNKFPIMDRKIYDSEVNVWKTHGREYTITWIFGRTTRYLRKPNTEDDISHGPRDGCDP